MVEGPDQPQMGDDTDDVLARRTRISIETFDRGALAARPVAELMGAELGWDRERIDDEVNHWLRRVEAEYQSQQRMTDQEADEARVSASGERADLSGLLPLMG